MESCHESILPNLSASPDGQRIYYQKIEFFPDDADTTCARTKNNFDKGNYFFDTRKTRAVEERYTAHPVDNTDISHTIFSRIKARYMPDKKHSGSIDPATIGDIGNVGYDQYSVDPLRRGTNNYVQVHLTTNIRSEGFPYFDYYELKYGQYLLNKTVSTNLIVSPSGNSATLHSSILGTPLVTDNFCWLLVPFEKRLNIFPTDSDRSLSTYCDNPSRIPSTPPSDLLEITTELPIENTADFDALSLTRDQLQVVYQRGFKNGESSEKTLSGDLWYKLIQRIYKSVIDPENNLSSIAAQYRELAVNLTKNCEDHFSGWESDVTFTPAGRSILFIAQHIKGNEASMSDLYVGNVEQLLDGNCLPSLRNLTKHMDYPVYRYKLSSDGTELSIQFLKEGSTPIHFYQFNSGLNSYIAYDSPLIPTYAPDLDLNPIGITFKEGYQIKNFGFIRDYVTIPYRRVTYVLASWPDYPDSIYRCVVFRGSYDCGSKFEPLITSKLGKEISEQKEGDRVNLDVVDYTISDTGEVVLHRFILYPPGYSKDQCVLSIKEGNGEHCPPIIVSIHGGPTDAWYGKFNIREYELAKKGYIVVMPNPTGSVGFGQEFTDSVRGEWGGQVYRDLKKLFKAISTEPESKYFLSNGDLYVIGFSFGGYMVNWMQTKDHDIEQDIGKRISAFVTINGTIDLKVYAEGTDQLWYPEYQLGCSGVGNCSEHDFKFNPIDAYPNEDENKIVVCADLFTKETITPKELIPTEAPAPACIPTPTMVVFGTLDERVPTVESQTMLDKFVTYDIPTSKMEFFTTHSLSDGQEVTLATDIHKWFQAIKKCDEGSFSNYLACDAFSNKKVLAPSVYSSDIDRKERIQNTEMLGNINKMFFR